MAGIIGIIKSWGIIKSAVVRAAKELKGKSDVDENVKRTQRDISFKIIAIGSLVTILVTFLLLVWRDGWQPSSLLSPFCSWLPSPFSSLP